MKVSIIIPVFNAEPFLNDCVVSLVNQTYKNIEVIFVNDCSTDASLELLSCYAKKYSLHIVILNNIKNSGTAFSRNTGVKAASGEYIYFMDADDTITSNCIELLVKSAEQNGFPDIALCNVDVCGYYKKIEKKRLLIGNKSVRKSYFSHEWYEMPWNKLIRKAFLDNHALEFSPEIYFEDSLWSFETALKAESILLLPDETYHYRKSETQKTARSDIEKSTKDSLLLYEKMFERVDGLDSSLYLTNIAQGFLFSKFVLNKDYKELCYKELRKLFRIRTFFPAVFSAQIPIGMKIMLLYRLMPYNVGLRFLSFYASKVQKTH